MLKQSYGVKGNIKISGYTLVEILITLGLALLIITGVLGTFSYLIKKNKDIVAANQLTSDLQSILTMMSQEIRRAGYWRFAARDIGTGQNTNPFMQQNTDLHINASKNCILFSYDRNANGHNDDERYGFRLADHRVQVRPNGAPFHCNAALSQWNNVTDLKDIQIDRLVFDKSVKQVPIPSSQDKLLMRTITITITGALKRDPAIKKTFTAIVPIANSKYQPYEKNH